MRRENLTGLVRLEAGRPTAGCVRARSPARLWAVVWLVALGWALVGLVSGQGMVANPDGWPSFSRFWAAALAPELSPGFLRITLQATLTTLAFAVLGTVLSILIGVVVGVLISETWWESPTASRRRQARARSGWLLSRAAVALPRGVHEAVWGLFLVSILGRDPAVGVLAIAIPFGAITAKVYSEMIDESAQGPYQALRAGGASRVSCLMYAVFPRTLPDLISYAFYRFECSVRSAVILGIIGAGGLGFQLMLSFQGLQYSQMWTLTYALIAVSAVADRWGSALRRGSPTGARVSLLAAAGLVVASVVHLGPDLSRVFSERTRDLFIGVVADMLPPRLPSDGWGELVARSVETVQMSLVAATFATTLAVAVAFVAARNGRTAAHRLASWFARWVLLVTRAIPPPVWALLVLFVMFPGPLPGAVALGIYNFGILGRLCAEVVENLDSGPSDALITLGAPQLSGFAYATVPMASGQFLSYGLYRWEVAVRETVIVGVVGAGGLGRLLEEQRAAFDYAAMAGTVLGLVMVSLLVDLVSISVRRSLREMVRS